MRIKQAHNRVISKSKIAIFLIILMISAIHQANCEEEQSRRVLKVYANPIVIDSDDHSQKDFNAPLMSENEARRRKLGTFSDFISGIADEGFKFAMNLGQAATRINIILDPLLSATTISLPTCSTCSKPSIYNCMGLCANLNLQSLVSFRGGSLQGNVLNDLMELVGLNKVTMKFLGVKTQVNLSGLLTEGVLGIAPLAAAGPAGDLFVAMLVAQGVINVLSMGMKYTSDERSLSFGGYDSIVQDKNKLMSYLSSSNSAWTVNFNFFYYGSKNLNGINRVMMLGSPIKIMYLPSDYYSSLSYAINQGRSCGYSTSGYFACYCSSIDEFEDLKFEINGIQYIIPKKNWIDYRSSSNSYCEFKIASSGSNSGVLEVGVPFLKSVYHYFDYQNNIIKFYAYDNNAQCTSSYQGDCPYSSSFDRYNLYSSLQVFCIFMLIISIFNN